MNEERETINEFTFHFTVDELRKFQIMEVMQDKMTYFLKFMNINYDKETITFDFNAFSLSFLEFRVVSWLESLAKNLLFIKIHKIF